MISSGNIPSFVYKILLVVATVIWGGSFVVMKNVVEVLPAAWLLGIRMLPAGIILGLVLFGRMRRAFAHDWRRAIGAGLVLGALDFAAFWAQTVGLASTTPGINAFLTATYCVIVPFLWWVIARKRPTVFNLGAAVLAVAGIWLVSSAASGEVFTLGFGEGMTLVGAVFFALHIVAVSKFARRTDALVLTAIQFTTEGALGLLVGAATEVPPTLSVFTPELVASMAFLTLFATIVAFGFQNVGLAHVPPSQAALLLSLESVFGVLFSVVLYGEELTARLLLGFALIFAAIVISETLPLKRSDAASDAAGGSEGAPAEAPGASASDGRAA